MPRKPVLVTALVVVALACEKKPNSGEGANPESLTAPATPAAESPTDPAAASPVPGEMTSKQEAAAACTATGAGIVHTNGTQVNIGENMVREGLTPVISIDQLARDLGVRPDVGIEIGATVEIKVTDANSGAAIAPTDFNAPYDVTLSGYKDANDASQAPSESANLTSVASPPRRIAIAITQEDGVVRIIPRGPGGFTQINDDLVVFPARGSLLARYVIVTAESLLVDQVYFAPPIAISPLRLKVWATSTSATVSWELPGSNGGYRVSAAPAEAGAAPSKTVDVFGYAAEAAIRDLLPGTRYRFSVVALNGAPPDRRLETPPVSKEGVTAPPETPVVHLLFTQKTGTIVDVFHAVRADQDWSFDALGESYINPATVDDGYNRQSHEDNLVALELRSSESGKYYQPVVAKFESIDPSAGYGRLRLLSREASGAWGSSVIQVPRIESTEDISINDLDLTLEADQTPNVVLHGGGTAVQGARFFFNAYTGQFRRPLADLVQTAWKPSLLEWSFQTHVLLSDRSNVQHRFATRDANGDQLLHDVFKNGAWASAPNLSFSGCQFPSPDPATGGFTVSMGDLRIDSQDQIHGLVSCRSEQWNQESVVHYVGQSLYHFSGDLDHGYTTRLVAPASYQPPADPGHDLSQSAVAVAADGAVYAAYRDPFACPTRVVVAKMAPGSQEFSQLAQSEAAATVGVDGDADSCNVIAIKMAADRNGKLHLVYLLEKGAPNLFYATNASGSWKVSPVRANTGGAGHEAWTLNALMIDGVPTHSNPLPL